MFRHLQTDENRGTSGVQCRMIPICGGLLLWANRSRLNLQHWKTQVAEMQQAAAAAAAAAAAEAAATTAAAARQHDITVLTLLQLQRLPTINTHPQILKQRCTSTHILEDRGRTFKQRTSMLSRLRGLAGALAATKPEPKVDDA